MKDRDEIIKHLCFVYTWATVNPKYGMGLTIEECLSAEEWIDDAIKFLRAQHPRVITLEDIRVIYHRREDHVWPFDTPPYLWVETNGRTVPYWMSWSNIIACLEGQFPKYDPDDYGKTWRCWTSRPTDEQREATPWTSPQ